MIIPHRSEIRILWSKVPKVKCKGLCHTTCTVIGLSEPEACLIEERTGKPLQEIQVGLNGQPRCAYLGPDNRCTIYEVRPLICRFFGAIKEMPCPHGCEVEGGPLPARQSHKILRQAGRYGSVWTWPKEEKG